MMNLKKVRKIISKIPDIHRGGCAISAIAMYRWLKMHNPNADVEFVYIYNNLHIYKNNNSYLFGNERLQSPLKFYSPFHCCLLYNGKIIDAYGEVDIRQWGKFIHIIPYEGLVLKNINEFAWSRIFERKNIERIENKLKIDLSDINKITRVIPDDVHEGDIINGYWFDNKIHSGQVILSNSNEKGIIIDGHGFAPLKFSAHWIELIKKVD